MSRTTIKTLSSGQTANLLGLALGSARQWTFFLADCIRGRTNFHGLTLEPVGQIHDRCDRPVYEASDVVNFIRAARAFVSPSSAYRTQLAEMDLAAYSLPWQMRRLEIAEGGAS